MSVTRRPVAPRTGGRKEQHLRLDLQTLETGAGGKGMGVEDGSPAPSGEHGRKKGALSGRKKYWARNRSGK